jgi:hypothetical protein
VLLEFLDSVSATGDTAVLADSDFVRRLLGFLKEERCSFLSFCLACLSLEVLRCCWLEVDLARLRLLCKSEFLEVGTDEFLEEE